MRLSMRNQSTKMWPIWTPYFSSQPHELWLYLTVATPVSGGTEVGSVMATGSYLRESKWILWRLQCAGFREKWEAETLSPISLSVSTLEVPDGLVIWENQPGLSAERKYQAGQSSRLLCNISQTNHNKNRGRKACQKRMALISYICIAFREHHLDRCLKALRWSSVKVDN